VNVLPPPEKLVIVMEPSREVTKAFTKLSLRPLPNSDLPFFPQKGISLDEEMEKRIKMKKIHVRSFIITLYDDLNGF